MKTLKKMLMGIAIMLMGITISTGFDFGYPVLIGWGISLFGLIVTALSLYFSEDED